MAEGKFLQLTISRVDGPIFDGRVLFVTVPGIAGEMAHKRVMTLPREHSK
jgi:F0F1-type ATP synthase epsilon subunit